MEKKAREKVVSDNQVPGERGCGSAYPYGGVVMLNSRPKLERE
jgi:hypothetical protein